MSEKQIDFIDLKSQQALIRPQLMTAFEQVLDHGRYILGPEVAIAEKQLAAFGETEYCLSCSSGSDALLLPLMAFEIGPGDAVFVPSFTFAATAEMVALLGATPVFVDILPDTFNMDPANLNQAIEEITEAGSLTPKAVIAVDLFGQIADYPALKAIADKYDLKLVADSAQGFGATLEGKQAGQWADAVTTSFFPAKPLGVYGDGGAVLTNDQVLTDIMESIRVHGQGSDRYDNIRIGLNARFDTLQAVVLIEKLALFKNELELRHQVAMRYNKGLSDVAIVPELGANMRSSWAQYTLRLENRDKVAAHLAENKIPTAIYYPIPLHQQKAYHHFPVAGESLPVTEQLKDEVLSLPMHPYLDHETQDYIIDQIILATQQTS